MPKNLTVIRHGTAPNETIFLLGGACAAGRITGYAEQRVDTPQISLALHAYFQGTGELVQTPHGLLPSVRFVVLAHGVRRSVVGVAVPLTAGALIRFPVGYLAAKRSEQGFDAPQKPGHALRPHSDRKIYQVPR